VPISATQLYGCHSKPRERRKVVVQDGWRRVSIENRSTGVPTSFVTPNLISIPDPMSSDCRYDRAATDARCAGCPNMPQQSA
jgi:hypothetical protein